MTFANSEANSDDNEENNKRVTYNLENALESIGYGKFQWQITLVCGLGYLAAGTQYGLNSYLIPAASCDLEMDSARMGTLNSVFLAGSVFSTYLWGLCADLVGRKGILVWTLLIDGILTLASSFSQHFMMFCIFRFFAGFLVASPSCLLFAYLGEFHSAKDSPRSVCILGFFFTLSWLILPGICWLILPIKWSYHSPDGSFIYNSWRILVALVSLPLFISAALIAFEPESPKYLVSQGKLLEAEKILQKMQLMNFDEKTIQTMPVLQLTDEEKNEITPVKKQDSRKQLIATENSKSMKRLLGAVWHQTRALFVMPHVKLTALFALISFANMFGFFGLGLWLPELFNRLEQHYSTSPNETVTVCELSKMISDLETDSSVSTGEVASCLREESINPQVFSNTLIMGAVCLLGNLVSIFLSKRLEYRILPVSTMLLSGLCVVGIYLFRSSTGNLVASTLFQASISTANYSIYSVVIELFPTSVRAVGLAVGLLAGRLSSVVANLLLGQLLEFNCHLLFALIIAVLICGGILCIFIPKNTTTKS